MQIYRTWKETSATGGEIENLVDASNRCIIDDKFPFQLFVGGGETSAVLQETIELNLSRRIEFSLRVKSFSFLLRFWSS
jgi:hypothetical protein